MQSLTISTYKPLLLWWILKTSQPSESHFNVNYDDHGNYSLQAVVATIHFLTQKSSIQ